MTTMRRVLVSLVFLAGLAGGCIAPSVIQDALALEGQAVGTYASNVDRISATWATLYTSARQADVDYTTGKVIGRMQALAAAGTLTPEQLAIEVAALLADRDKAVADTGRIVTRMQAIQELNRGELAKAIRLRGSVQDWLSAGIDATAVPGMIDEVGAVIQAMKGAKP